MIHSIFDARNWAAVPFHFWSVMAFIFGCMVGSFLNVCIHRLPLGQSIVSPPSHCPHCQYSIPWYLNIPLVTWVYLRGKCRNCGAPISARYFLVELLTGLAFLAVWAGFGRQSAWLALVYMLFMALLIVATFIDFEHLIIPDEITIGGIAAGFICSFLVPSLQGSASLSGAMKQSLLGIGVGAGLIYFIVRMGKLILGRHRLHLAGSRRIVFSETAVHLPEKDIPYEDIFYRASDTIRLNAQTVELVDRCYKDVEIKLSPAALYIGEEKLNPEQVPHLEAVSSAIVLPREAMGLGDVKFMAAIGAFLGWRGVLFSLAISSFIGALVGVTFMLVTRRRLSRLPYGPYIALAAVIWIFAGPDLVKWYQRAILGLH